MVIIVFVLANFKYYKSSSAIMVGGLHIILKILKGGERKPF